MIEKNEIEGILKPYADSHDYEIFEIDIRTYKNETSIEILVDKPSGGITIDQCADVNIFLNSKLEEQNIENYSIQVSSPGLDRPLRTQKEFFRVIGSEIQVYLKEPLNGRIQYDGVLKNADNDKILLMIKQNLITIPLNIINKGLQVI